MATMKSVILPLLLPTAIYAFSMRTSSMRMSALQPSDRVLLIGPSFLQLNIAKALKSKGLVPMIVAPQKSFDSFSRYVNDPEIMANADIGLPDDMGIVKGVVFCSESAVFSPELVKTVLDWEGFSGGGLPQRVACCAPLSINVSGERASNWMPVLNNDKKEKEIWKRFVGAWYDHPVAKGSEGTLIRFGTLLGGSVDGPEELAPIGLDESIYKMSLENYRDLKERSFDRLRLGVQLLEGETYNKRPPNQEKIENQAIKKGEDREVFRASGGYPDQDRTNRHAVAQAVVQTLMRSGDDLPKEFTILSKCTSCLPTPEDWDDLFQNPGPAKWPDPYKFDISLLEPK